LASSRCEVWSPIRRKRLAPYARNLTGRKGDFSCLVDLVPDMASLMQAERNAGAKDLVILGGLGLDSPLPKTEWEQLGAR